MGEVRRGVDARLLLPHVHCSMPRLRQPLGVGCGADRPRCIRIGGRCMRRRPLEVRRVGGSLRIADHRQMGATCVPQGVRQVHRLGAKHNRCGFAQRTACVACGEANAIEPP